MNNEGNSLIVSNNKKIYVFRRILPGGAVGVGGFWDGYVEEDAAFGGVGHERVY
jgi:hypothetical protein